MPTRAPEANLLYFVLAGTKHVARIVPRGDGCDFESGGNFGRQIFQAVHCKIDAPSASASSISLVNMPLVPTLARATSVILSPVVLMILISTS